MTTLGRREWVLVGIIALLLVSLVVQEFQVRTCRYRLETWNDPGWSLTQMWTRGCLHEAGNASWTSNVPCHGTEARVRVVESRE